MIYLRPDNKPSALALPYKFSEFFIFFLQYSINTTSLEPSKIQTLCGRGQSLPTPPPPHPRITNFLFFLLTNYYKNKNSPLH